MAISIYNDFSDYMMSKEIKKVDVIDFKYKNTEIDIPEELIIKQFGTIYAIHEKCMGFNGYLRNRLNNNTGKTIEDYKRSIKKLNVDINNIKKDGPQNLSEEIIIKYGQEAMERGEKCIREVQGSNYLEIVKRSMRRCEICLGNTDFQNLRANDFINVVDFNNCCYNMVEMDCLPLLSRLKRKGAKFDFCKLTKEFCYIEGLEADSEKFLIALISYPHEFMKCCNRYRSGKRMWNEDNFSGRITKALVQDGDPLF